MRHLLHWMKPLEQQKEPGIIAGGIVTWRKTPFSKSTYTFDTVEGDLTVAMRKTYTSKYEYECYIDLWMLKVRLAWLGREQKPPTQ